MAKKSNRSPQKRISATKAGRSFSRVLNEIEKGKSFVVYRRGRDVCEMTPITSKVRTVSECLAILHGRPVAHLDDRFGSDLIEIIAGETADARPWD